MSPHSGRQPLVLVAEDHDDTRAMLETLLGMHGFDVVGFGDGDAALAAATRLAPDVLLVDGHLRGLDGFGLTRAIRARDGDVPIVFVSGWSGAEHEVLAQECGCTHYLLKPIDLDRLVDLLRRLTVPAR